MSWTWRLEDADGTEVGRSPSFDSQSDAETWIGVEFGDLLEDGVAQATLFDGDAELYGPMGLAPQ